MFFKVFHGSLAFHPWCFLAALTRGAATILLVLAGLLGVSQPTSAADGQFVNLSTRALVATGDEVMIGGFIIEEGARQVLIQAVGPELANAGISNALADPVLTVTNTTDPGSPIELMVNDNWEDSQEQLITDLWGGSPPLAAGSQSAAAVLTLDPGNYTAKVEGKDGTAGIAIVEVYRIDSAVTGSPDLEAIMALYNAMDGENWIDRTNWLSDAPLDQWYGVSVDDRDRVIGLDLHDNQLSGPIPAELVNLESLQSLRLSSNNLTGAIPSNLGNLANLQFLNLSGNQLSGPIPAELGSVPNLTDLWLNDNNLTGAIPSQLGNLANLQALSLSRNQLSGPIPTELGNLSNLQSLNLFDNQFSGQVPKELGKQASLLSLSLSGNQLSGPIPAELGDLASLQYLDLSRNQLSGPIPARLGNLANLQSLSLSRNQLSGPIPTELGSIHNLEQLQLDYNQLSESIPLSFLQLKNLRFFYINDNLGLCVPRSSIFLAWYQQIDTTDDESSIFCNTGSPDLEALTALYNTTDGENWIDRTNWLSGAPLDQWYGVSADDRDRVTGLDLHDNNLTGAIPTQLGNLANLQFLNLSRNQLSGPIPLSFLQLKNLRFFYINDNQGLCVPGSSNFLAWWRQIDSPDDESSIFCNAADKAALESLFESTSGTDWTEASRWLGDSSVEEWHGVSVDSLGRVTNLELTNNGLSGHLPSALGNLAHMTELRVADNPRLSGRLPLSLANVPLHTLHFSGTEVCVPEDEWLREWLKSIPSHQGTGLECVPLSDREILAVLYKSTGGPEWTNNENWLSDGLLVTWSGVNTDENGQVISLELGDNNLMGPLPPEIGGLKQLTFLVLEDNKLRGPLPAQFGGLSSLEILFASESGLTGPIPPEFGELSNLHWAELRKNNLMGSLPSELGNLSNLEELDLAGNELTGPIPPEFGNLSQLRRLWLENNRISGPLPPELGNLSSVNWLHFDNNELTGPVPPEFGGLAGLVRFSLNNNSGLSGSLPSSLTALREIETFLAHGTGLCVPSDPDFLDWFNGIRNRRVLPCEPGEPVMAYLTQAVQSREHPVPLVAGEKALLRAFVTAARANDAPLPAAKASFYLNGALAHVANISTKPGPVPTEIDEGSLAKSANALIPAEVVQPGLEMVIEVDPVGILDSSLGVAKRIPETGRLALDVQTMPLFDLTLIPFVWTETQDSSIVELINSVAADPEGHELLSRTRTLLPVGRLEVTAHEPVESSSNNMHELFSQALAIQIMEDGAGHYMGIMSRPVTGAAGSAEIGGRASSSIPANDTIAHELGHNLSLGHAPCGDTFADPWFPYPDGSTGAWGYDFDLGSLVPPTHKDLMSYCGPVWISDYHFTTMLRFRLIDEEISEAAVAASPSQSLLLWGGVDHEGKLFLEPAFIIDAPPSPPDSVGDYEITGFTEGGGELFSLKFAMPEMAHGDGSSSFAFALPIQPDWVGELSRIILTGPGGSAALNRETDRPMTILRDLGSGQVRGILRDLPEASATQVEAATTQDEATAAVQTAPDLEVLFSRGIPGATAWRR